MFDKNYYCLVAGLREYSLDADTKGFNARAIIEEILEGVSARDARCVRLLYGYYDCENLVNFRKGRAAHNPLGNLSREEIEEQTKNPDRLPARMATVVRSYSAIVDEDADNEDGIDTDRSFENALFSAYYDECAHSKSRFLRQWADFDRNLRNISAAVVARVTGRSAEQAVVGGDKQAKRAVEILLQYKAVLEQGLSARTVELEKEDRKLVADLNLLTDKPVLYVCNVDEKSAVTGNEHTRAVEAAIADERAEMLIVAAATEADIAELDEYEERQMFLEEIGLKESGVARLIKAAYKLLDLQTFFTTGADESRAWTFRRGMKAPQTAGIIHTDFERGFIRAEVIKYDDYVALGSEKACRDQGKIGVEGKEYVVQDGDIMHFLFNV